jgi:hypothetical protein
MMTTLRYGGERERVEDGRQAAFDQRFSDVIGGENWGEFGHGVVAMVMDAWEGREWQIYHPDETEEDGSVGHY